MNRINQLFENKKDILSIYFTAGYPEVDTTVEIITELEKAGVGFIEVGMPFSDPMADGPTIQQSSQKAIENGMSLNKLFSQLENIRSNTKLPLILMGYLNPVMYYGLENFLKKCSEVGIDGVILPDLPLSEYEEEYHELFEKYNIRNIFLITPQTPEERIRKIDEVSNGFIYLVSSAGTTGAKANIADSQEAYFDRIQKMNLKNPCVIGFGISSKETFDKACQYASGAIIGSAFVKAIGEGKPVKETIQQFVKSIIE